MRLAILRLGRQLRAATWGSSMGRFCLSGLVRPDLSFLSYLGLLPIFAGVFSIISGFSRVVLPFSLGLLEGATGNIPERVRTQ